MKKILVLISGVAAGIALCLVAAYHLPVKSDEIDRYGDL